MKKLLNKPWFVAVLVVSAVVLCTWSIRDQMGMGGPSTRGPDPVAQPVSTAEEESTEALAAPEGEAGPVSIATTLDAMVFPDKIQDPFQPRQATLVAGEPEPDAPVSLPDEHESIQLTAVWAQGAMRLALVNDRIVQAGDAIGRLKIADVSVDGIWVTHWKGRDYVPFGGDFTLVTPAGGVAAKAVAIHEN